MSENENSEAVPREMHKEEMDRLKLEIQQCKDFIQTQQQLLQVSAIDSDYTPFNVGLDWQYCYCTNHFMLGVDFMLAAADKLSMWWGDGVPAEQLLHVAGERPSQRRVEDARGAEKDLWEGEEKLYRSSHKTKLWGDSNVSLKAGVKWSILFYAVYFVFIFDMNCIWLKLQRKAFEEDRAMWLKHQFLKFSPFEESKKSHMSKSKSAFLICECSQMPLTFNASQHIIKSQ